MEANINEFLDSENVHDVMLSQYLKALGVYQETCNFNKSKKSELSTAVPLHKSAPQKKEEDILSIEL